MNLPSRSLCKVKRNASTAEIVGLSFGDGGLTYRTNSQRVKFQLRGNLSEDFLHYDNFVIPLFNKQIMEPLFNRKVGRVFNKRMNFYGISVESVRIERPLNFLGIPSGKKNELVIPRWIKSNQLYLKRFLRGFFDTDGSLSCHRNYSIKNNGLHTQINISLCCTSKTLMREIYILLLQSGFKCFLYHGRPKNPRYKDYYSIKLGGGIQVKRWMQFIGSKNPKHLSKYLIWKRFGFCPPFTKLEDRMRILKNEASPYSIYEREC